MATADVSKSSESTPKKMHGGVRKKINEERKGRNEIISFALQGGVSL